jgi:hypothetical protein
VGVLGVAGLAAIVFGLIQLRRTVIRPFTTDVQSLVELKKRLGPSEEELAAERRRTDTDGDGISDEDELNTYRTSPYLADSDSDGTTDNLEIAKGTDPNCPTGKNCLTSSSGTEAATSTGFTVPPAGTNGFFGGAASPVPPRDAEAIRTYLRASGMSDAELSAYSDAQLLEAYDQSAAQGGSAAATGTVSP